LSYLEVVAKGFPQGNEAVKEVSPTGRLYFTAKRLEINSPGLRSCLAGLGTLNVASRPARRSLGEVGRDALIIGLRRTLCLESKRQWVGRPFRARRLASLHPGLKPLGYSVRPLRGHRQMSKLQAQAFRPGFWSLAIYRLSGFSAEGAISK